LKVPATVGVPLIVIVLATQEPVTPAGSPLKFAPVAFVVEYVILVIGVLISTVWEVVAGAEVREMVWSGLIVTVTVAQVVVLQVPL
jgi:hypothetical protein